MENRSLFATLIGINAYDQFPLNGCINDVLAIDRLLREQCTQQGKDKLAYNPKYFLAPSTVDKKRIATYKKDMKVAFSAISPSFENITTQAFQHLKNAKDGDICLLYYSGHGSQTEAAPEFWDTKPNRLDETLVCLDSRDNNSPSARDLLDKELAYLLWDALKGKDVHCLVIMDCCHSGNNTRAMSTTVAGNIKFRQVEQSKTKIPFTQFIGHGDKDFYEEVDGKVKIKIARYVHLAAALDTEKAEESSDGGLFSIKLMEVLRAGGTAKSYRELMRNVGASVRIRNQQQNPVPFALVDEDLDQQFLGKGIIPFQPAFEVRFFSDPVNPQWRMLGGAIDGITPSAGDAKTIVNISGSDKEIIVNEVFATYSVLDATGMEGFDKANETYTATIAKLAEAGINIGLSGRMFLKKEMVTQLETAYKNGKFPHISINFSEDPGSVDYLIDVMENAAGSAYILTLPQDQLPRFKREQVAARFLVNVNAVGKWEAVNRMKKTSEKFTSNSFVFKLEKLEGIDFMSPELNKPEWPHQVIQPDEEIVCNFKDGHRPIIRLKISIAPGANFTRCFVGALYMDCRFGISHNLIKQDANQLTDTPGAFITLRPKAADGSRPFDNIVLDIDEKFAKYNINEVIDSIKIFISEKHFNLDNYEQAELPLDDLGTRPMLAARDRTSTDTNWAIFNFNLRIVGPNKKKQLRGNDVVQFSAFSIKSPEGFSAEAIEVTADDMKDKLKAVSTRSIDSVAGVRALVPPASIWGNAVTDASFPVGLGSLANNSVEAIELFPSKEGQALVLEEDKEVIITPKAATGIASPAEELTETVVPFGYDPQSDLYFPIGYEDQAGNIHIQTLPQPTPQSLYGEQTQTRSLGGSIKLYFKKLIRAKETNKLVLYEFTDNNGWQKVQEDPEDPDKIHKTLSAKPNTNALLLIHGITGDTKYMLESIQQLPGLSSKAAFLLTYDYENLSSPISQIADELDTALSAAGFGTANMPSLTVVAHSMGGLVARWLAEIKRKDKFINHLVMVGTPCGGSEMASLGKSVTGMLTHALNVTGPLKYAITGLSFLLKKLKLDPLHTLGELKPGSLTVEKLRQSVMNKATIYTVIGGDTSLLKNGYNGDDAFLKKISFAIKNNIVYPGLTTSVFAGEPNDMAVTLKSMQAITDLEPTVNIRIVSSNHIGYFADKESLGHILNLLPAN